MNPKYRSVVFLGAVFVLMAPYLGFVVYYSRQFPRNQWPPWFINTLAVWFIVNFLLITLLMRLTRKLFRDQVVDVEKARVLAAKALRTNIRLLIFWSLLFLYGVIQTIRGKITVERAIPAGVFLLLFIALFGWSVYRDKRAKQPKQI